MRHLYGVLPIVVLVIAGLMTVGSLVARGDGPGEPGIGLTLVAGGTTIKSLPVLTITVTATETSTPTSTSTPTPTPTVTPLWPTDTPTPTATWASTPDCRDLAEPNDAPGSGPVLINNEAVSGLTLSPLGDKDFFRLWAKGGAYYQITTKSAEGVDTRLRVFDPTGALVAENDDYQPGDPASQLRFQAPGEGWFSVAVDSRVPAEWGCRQYQISALTTAPPTATSTPTSKPATPQRAPTSTPRPTAIPAELQYDDYEPNYDFASAANIGVGVALNLNFNTFPAGAPGVDNDFFRVYVKMGQKLLIETTNVAAGLDTNLILYRENGDVIMGNDDCKPGELRSCLEWAPDYTGVAYILAGPAGTIPEAIGPGARNYMLGVKDVVASGNNSSGGSYGQPSGGSGYYTPSSGRPQSAPGTPVSVPSWKVTPLPPTATPLPSPTPTFTPLPSPTPTATPVVQVRAIPMGPPTSTPRPPQAIAIGLSVYQDQNNNRAQDGDEAVRGISVRVLDSQSNQLLGYTLTDDYGHANLTVAAPGDVRLSVPFLAYNKQVSPPGGEFVIRLAPLRLPSLIP